MKGAFLYCDKKNSLRWLSSSFGGCQASLATQYRPENGSNVDQLHRNLKGINRSKDYCFNMDDDALLFKRHHINPWFSGSMESLSFEELEECLRHRGRSRIRKRSIIPGIYGGYSYTVHAQ